MSWWVGDLAAEGAYVELVSWVFWVLLSITLHELAHGWAAIRQGDDTPIRAGRMTANPLVHMGGYSLLVFALCGIAWGQMPVNPHRFRDGRRGDVYVSAAGPAMNLAIGLVCLVALTLSVRLVPDSTPLHRNAATFLFTGLGINMVLAPFNCLPIPPLDGAHILAGLSRRARGLFEHPNAPIIGTFAFIAVFFMSPIGGILIETGWRVAFGLADGAGRLLGNPEIGQVLHG